ncbi:MAG: deoxyribodipyrimidine photolyase [Myxococcales bacterium]|nr:deoxyribodipyrimidine photolyase [Myxococcales bacterium]
MIDVDPLRVRRLHAAPPRPAGAFVLYWMIAQRRPFYNHALQHAAHWAQRLGRPLVILEALRTNYPYASERLHRFIIDGMVDNAHRFASSGALYYPYLERERDGGKGLLHELGELAALVVTDHAPGFFFPRMLRAAAETLSVRLDAVDSNGLLPLALAGRTFASAYHFRRFAQHHWPQALGRLPLADPLLGRALPRAPALPESLLRRWPSAAEELGETGALDLAALPIDHAVPAVPALPGGHVAARARWRGFLAKKLDGYDQRRAHPDYDGASGLSPYLHFGQISCVELIDDVIQRFALLPHQLEPNRGQRDGYWGLPAGVEAFLDQLLTWRELGLNYSAGRPIGPPRLADLPEWAIRTLEQHRDDPRPSCYSPDQFDAAATHDELWNAAQRQLRREGTIQNYLRMLWGKKILEWSATPEQALSTMFALNDRYALDGRDPNSHSGIYWILGRYDRPFGPERPIFGKIRYMSSESARKKLRLTRYLAELSD